MSRSSRGFQGTAALAQSSGSPPGSEKFLLEAFAGPAPHSTYA